MPPGPTNGVRGGGAGFCVWRCAIDALIVGLIWLLIYTLVLLIVGYIVVRLLLQFFPGASAYTWIIWAIAGLILLLLVVRLLVPHIPGG